MKSLWMGVAGLLLGLSLLSSGASVARAQINSMAPLPIAGTTVQGFGAGLDASSAFQVGAPVRQAQMVDPACAVDLPDAAGDPGDTDNVQAENGADDVAEGDTGPDNAAEDASEGAGDTGTQQCGDQSENGNAAP